MSKDKEKKKEDVKRQLSLCEESINVQLRKVKEKKEEVEKKLERK